MPAVEGWERGRVRVIDRAAHAFAVVAPAVGGDEGGVAVYAGELTDPEIQLHGDGLATGDGANMTQGRDEVVERHQVKLRRCVSGNDGGENDLQQVLTAARLNCSFGQCLHVRQRPGHPEERLSCRSIVTAWEG